MMVANPANPKTESITPRHVAVIMDGNGRWARRRALPRQAGHQAGIKPVRATVECCAEAGVQMLTLFAFSSENWRRPVEEVRGLMSLFVDALEREVAELDANRIRLSFIGDLQAPEPALARRDGGRGGHDARQYAHGSRGRGRIRRSLGLGASCSQARAGGRRGQDSTPKK